MGERYKQHKCSLADDRLSLVGTQLTICFSHMCHDIWITFNSLNALVEYYLRNENEVKRHFIHFVRVSSIIL